MQECIRHLSQIKVSHQTLAIRQAILQRIKERGSVTIEDVQQISKAKKYNTAHNIIYEMRKAGLIGIGEPNVYNTEKGELLQMRYVLPTAEDCWEHVISSL